MTQIKKYTKKDGTTAYMFKKYLGVDPITGKQRETTRRGFATIKEAKIALARLEVEIEDYGLFNQASPRTYEEVFFDWFELVYKQKVKESTLWNTRFIFDKYILPALGKKKIKAITIRMCQKQANEWAKQSPKRFQRFINYAGMVFRYAMATEEIKSNPMERIILPSVEQPIDEKENFYNRDELLTFLSCMQKTSPYKRYAFFLLLAYTGMRKGEALALEWRDIDFKAMTITVNKTVAVGKNGALLVQQPKTKASNRTITIDDTTISTLKKWHRKQTALLKQLSFMPSVNQLVFPQDETNSLTQPKTPTNWLSVFYYHHKDMKRITTHGFRHTHASLLFESGANMKQVQTRLGHSNIKTTMNVYTHVSKDSQQETALLFNQFMRHGERLGQRLGQKKNPTHESRVNR